MRVQLLNMGFVDQGDGSFYNNELRLTVYLKNGVIEVEAATGLVKTDVEHLEEAILNGEFGRY
jgi:hypothetical protein